MRILQENRCGEFSFPQKVGVGRGCRALRRQGVCKGGGGAGWEVGGMPCSARVFFRYQGSICHTPITHPSPCHARHSPVAK